MRFNFDAYGKVYPDKNEPDTVIESAVETFRPTESEKATDNKPGEDVMNAVPKDEPEAEQKVPERIDENG